MKKLFFTLILTIFSNLLNAQGNYEWAIQITGKSDQYSKSICSDKYGNVIITGVFGDTTDFDPGADTFYLDKSNKEDVFIAKYDSSGKFIWAKKIGGPGSEESRKIIADDSGNVYVAGYFDGISDFNPDTAKYLVNSKGNEDAFILKINKQGEFQWVITYGTMGGEIAEDIKVDHSGNIVVTGSFGDIIDFDPGVDTFYLDERQGDIFVLKVKPNKDFIWAKNYGKNGDVVVKSLAIDHSNNIISGGAFQTYADFDPSAATYTLGPSVDGRDNYLLKLDSMGQFIWAKHFEGTSYDYGSHVNADKYNNVYFAGHYGLSIDFDPSAGVMSLKSQGEADIFVGKLDSAGNLLWAKSMGGIFGDYCYAMTIDDTGNVFTTGLTQGRADFDPGADTVNLKTSGSSEIYVSKLDSTGKFAWIRSTNGADASAGTGLAIDQKGNIYCTGYFSSRVDFDPSADTSYFEGLSVDAFILKLNADTFKLKDELLIKNLKEKNHSVQLFPNPNSGIFTIELKDENVDKIEIYNLMGTLVFKAENKTNPISIDISQLLPGVYVLKLFKDNHLFQTEKVLKK